MADETRVEEAAQTELSADNVSAAAPQVETAPVAPEAQAPAISQDEIERIKAEMKELRARVENEGQRTRQSLRDIGDSIVTRVTERYERERKPIDRLVQQQQLAPEVAQQELFNLRTSIEAEETNAAKAQSAQAAYSQKAQVESQMAQLLASSGITAQDPEAALLPQGQLSMSDPHEALDYYTRAVETAKRAKDERLKTKNTPARPAPPPGATNPPPQPNGAGGAGTARLSADDLARQLKEEMAKGRNADRKRMNDLEAALAKAGG